MADKVVQPHYSLGEEIANAIIHGIGAGLSVAGLVVMIVKSAGDPWKVVSSCIYGATLIILFTFSCLYHSISNKSGKRVMRVFDHLSIFLLIAGTYTPVCLVTLRGVWGWIIFGIVWASAVLGVVFNSISIERFKKISMIGYIAMGWCIVLAAVPVIRLMDWHGLLLLFLGGLAYTGGTLFYRRKDKRGTHMIWHVFVLLGALLQFFAVYFYIL